MIFPSPYLCRRVLPEALGRAVQKAYPGARSQHPLRRRARLHRQVRDRFLTRTRAGHEIESELVVVGVGIEPEVALAEAGRALRRQRRGRRRVSAHLPEGRLRRGRPGLISLRRALEEGGASNTGTTREPRAVRAGANMSGGHEPYDYLPYFFSDFFDLGYEAVGEVELAGWKRAASGESRRTKRARLLPGDGKVRGVLMCNVFGQVSRRPESSRRRRPRRGAQLGRSSALIRRPSRRRKTRLRAQWISSAGSSIDNSRSWVGCRKRTRTATSAMPGCGQGMRAP